MGQKPYQGTGNLKTAERLKNGEKKDAQGMWTDEPMVRIAVMDNIVNSEQVNEMKYNIQTIR